MSALIDRLRTHRGDCRVNETDAADEIERLQSFPRQKDNVGGWTIDYQFLRAVSEQSAVGMEECEAVLLAAEKARDT